MWTFLLLNMILIDLPPIKCTYSCDMQHKAMAYCSGLNCRALIGDGVSPFPRLVLPRIHKIVQILLLATSSIYFTNCIKIDVFSIFFVYAMQSKQFKSSHIKISNNFIFSSAIWIFSMKYQYFAILWLLAYTISIL